MSWFTTDGYLLKKKEIIYPYPIFDTHTEKSKQRDVQYYNYDINIKSRLPNNEHFS